jgi:putative peptidoglycan lipid II flippase
MDAYLAATTLPSLLSVILTTSLAATFLPVFTEVRQKNPEEAWDAAVLFMNLVAVAGLVACAVGMIFAAPILRLLTPGLDPSRLPLATELLRWLLPTVALTAVNQLLSGVYYAHGKFLAPGLIRVTAPLTTIVLILTLSERLHVRSLVLATLIAHTLQTGVLWAGSTRMGKLSLRFKPDWNHPAVRKTLRLTLPLMAAMGFYKLGPAFERWVASGLGTGAISILGYATRLTSVVQPVLISGIAISGFSLMAEQVAKRDLEGMKSLMSRSCGALFFASVPLAVLLAGFAHPLIALVYERGAFTPDNTSDTARLFALYALGLPAGAVGTVVGQAFYAFQDTRLPIIAGILDLGLFAGLATCLVPYWGLAALPTAFVFSLYVTTILITTRLAHKTGFSLWPLFARPFTQSLVSALIALMAGWGLQAFPPLSPAGSLAPSMLASACGLTLSVVTYFLVQRFVFRSAEASSLLRLFPGRKTA